MNWEAAAVCTAGVLVIVLMALATVTVVREESHRRQWFHEHGCRTTAYLSDLGGPVPLYTCDDGQARIWRDIPRRTR